MAAGGGCAPRHDAYPCRGGEGPRRCAGGGAVRCAGARRRRHATRRIRRLRGEGSGVHQRARTEDKGGEMKDERNLQPWQYPEERWRKIVNRVRAGKPLRPKSWQGGARCAIALSFDSDHETNELREGGESIGRLSQGQYGNRQGVPRILSILKNA